MKKGTILNSDISAIIAEMGHTDMLCIADAGLPIPCTTKRIDISLVKGTPAFMDTLNAVLEELQVEAVVLAQETADTSPAMLQSIKEKIGNIPVSFVSHEELKALTAKAKACIRTGECTPYANIILKSGVTF
jgi:D-ribose pyranase